MRCVSAGEFDEHTAPTGRRECESQMADVLAEQEAEEKIRRCAIRLTRRAGAIGVENGGGLAENKEREIMQLFPGES